MTAEREGFSIGFKGGGLRTKRSAIGRGTNVDDERLESCRKFDKG